MAPAAFLSSALTGVPVHGGNWNREELSVAHPQMINLSYVADKGELSGSLLHCLLLET